MSANKEFLPAKHVKRNRTFEFTAIDTVIPVLIRSHSCYSRAKTFHFSFRQLDCDSRSFGLFALDVDATAEFGDDFMYDR